MSTAYYKFTGKCKWAKLVEPDDFRGQKKWKINLYLDKAGQRQLNESEARLSLKTDDDGKYVTFSRPLEKKFKEEVKEQGAPWVLHLVDGEEQDFDDPTRIGNGSTVTCKISVFDTQMGKGHQLEAVRVDELVEYKKDENHTDEKRF